MANRPEPATMGQENLQDLSHWYVLQTNPRNEDRAASNLQAWGLNTLNPKFKQICYNERKGQPSHTIKCLFPQYIFARFNAQRLLHKVRFTRGVQRVVSFGGLPTPVDDDVVAIIRHRTGQDGLVRISDELRPGDEVTIKHGPFRNLVGVFEKKIEDSDRVFILLTTLSYQARVVMDRGLIEKLPQPN